jgi:hypothetical protein
MAGIHNSIMLMTQRLARSETIVEQDSTERALNKLARTFVSQVEALERHRGAGQSVTVRSIAASDDKNTPLDPIGRSRQGDNDEKSDRLN